MEKELNYYESQLSRLEPIEKDCGLVKFYCGERETKMLTLNKESAQAIVDFLTHHFLEADDSSTCDDCDSKAVHHMCQVCLDTLRGI